MLKKPCIVLFVFLILSQSGGISIIQVVSIKLHKAAIKAIAKKELKQGLHDRDLEYFTEDQLANAEWEHSKEFFLGDEKYDVVKTSKRNGKIIYHCINDKKEKELFSKLDSGRKRNRYFEDIIKKICLNLPQDKSELLQLPSLSIDYSVFQSDSYSCNYWKKTFRPPTFLLS